MYLCIYLLFPVDDEKTLKYAGSKLNLNFWRQRFDCGGCGSQTPDGPAEKKQKKGEQNNDIID